MPKPGRTSGRRAKRGRPRVLSHGRLTWAEALRSKATKGKDLTFVLALSFLTGCATAFRPGTSETIARAKQAATYSGEVRLSLDGPLLRARTPVLVGFRRPEALRIEVPGPGSARLIAVARDGRFVAVFPGQKAFFDGEASPEVLEALFGVALAPAEVMDLLVGVGGPRVRDYRADWGPAFPERIEAILPDGGKLKLKIVAADFGPDLLDEAFAPPAHDGFRRVSADEARTLWQ